MRCLTPIELTQALEAVSMPLHPYEDGANQKLYLQFELPKENDKQRLLIPKLITTVTALDFIVVELFEWGEPPTPGDRILSIRRRHNELRYFDEAPAHSISSKDSVLASEIVIEATIGMLSNYVYFPYGRSCFYFWEGDLADFWTDCPTVYQHIHEIVCSHRLKILHHTEQSDGGNQIQR